MRYLCDDDRGARQHGTRRERSKAAEPDKRQRTTRSLPALPTMAANVQEKMRALTDEYTKLTQEQQKLVLSQQRLNAQKTENDGVMKEFERLADGESIYKLVGPVLLKQDKVEADSTVKGRLDFIKTELARLEAEIKASNQAMDQLKDQIMALQDAAQAGPPPAAVAGGP